MTKCLLLAATQQPVDSMESRLVFFLNHMVMDSQLSWSFHLGSVDAGFINISHHLNKGYNARILLLVKKGPVW